MTREKLARLPEVLFEIGKAIGSDENLSTLLSHISELVCEAVEAEACSIMLLDRSRERLVGRAGFGLTRRDVSGIRFEVGEGVAGWVAQHGEPALISDVSSDDRFVELSDSKSDIRSLACVPLVSQGKAVGVLTTTSSQSGAFTPADVDLLIFIAKTIVLDLENKRLRRLSVTDQLTGAFNREFLQQNLAREIESAEARGVPLAVAMLDVDHFKQVNDRFGHDVGDKVLAEVAVRLRGAIRDDDLLIRYGGEEFLVLLPKTDAEKACEVGERMRRRLEDEAIPVGDEEMPIRISVGVAEHRRGDEDGAELVRRADEALYEAKRRGRNRVEAAP